jgi:tetratricopeptide (TPR) repeat protein
MMEGVDPTEAAGQQVADLRHRLVDLLQGGDVDAVDAELDARVGGDGDQDAPQLALLALWRGMRALLDGRFDGCRRANHAAAAAAAAAAARAGGPDPWLETACGMQAFQLRVAEGRLAEAEVLLRGLLAGTPEGSAAGLHASLAWLLGLLGRDSEARSRLARLSADRFAALDDGAGPASAERVAALAHLAELVTVLDHRTEAAALYNLLLPHRGRVAVQGGGAACLGSLSRHLGLLAHALGRWDDALEHFEAALAENRRLGAPLLVAHTCRQWSALLRAGGDDRHWEQAIDLLDQAERIYRRLGVDGLADEASSVLARTAEVDVAGDGARNANLFRHNGDGWVVRWRGNTLRLEPARGLADLACLLANPGRSIHVADLVAGPTPADAARAALGRAGLAPPWDAAGPDGVRARHGVLDAETETEYRARLARVDDELAHAVATADRVTAALLKAERDVLTADLAAGTEVSRATDDTVERARRAVATRIRLALDGIEGADPALGRHLRHSLRMGTFCSYEPAVPTTWSV